MDQLFFPMNTEGARLWFGRIPRGEDLLDSLDGICQRFDFRTGWIDAIGAVDNATIGFFDQKERSYRKLVFERPMEITHLSGNISMKANKPFVHAHVTLADEDGRAYGGHLMQGTRVFVLELRIQVLESPILTRVPDKDTLLHLWPKPRGSTMW